MKRLRLLQMFLLFAVLSISACSTKQITMAPTRSLVDVSRNVSSIEISGIGNQGVDANLVRELTKYIKAKLIIAGFDLEKDLKGMTLDVDILTFTPGNAATRLIVGFGAGRGSLIYTAKYISCDGKILAEMEGRERFTGAEAFTFNQEYGEFSTLGGAKTVKSVLIQEAAKHIVELASSK